MKHIKSISLKLFIAVILCFSLVGCREKKPALQDGVYVMDVISENSSLAPTLSINTKEKTFTFTYDVLSSYLPYGTYTVKDSLLTCKTDDGIFTYTFNIEDDNTLSFVDNPNCNMTTIESGIKVTTGKKFILNNEYSRAPSSTTTTK